MNTLSSEEIKIIALQRAVELAVSVNAQSSIELAYTTGAEVLLAAKKFEAFLIGKDAKESCDA